MSAKRLTAKMHSDIRGELLAAICLVTETEMELGKTISTDLHDHYKRRTLHRLNCAIRRLVDVRSIIANLKP